jgi:hypothetical protein
MKAKLVRESIEEIRFPISELCDGTISYEDIKPYIEKSRGNKMPDPGFYSDHTVETEEDYHKYLEQFERNYGCEGELEWRGFYFGVEGNKKYNEAAARTADAVGYGKGRYMGD